MKAKLALLMLFVVLLLLSSEFALAQGLGITTGTLSGEVKDESGFPIPRVLIHVSSNSGTKSTTTDSEGKYIFPYLIPTVYNVRSELQGFSTVEQKNIRIGLGQRVEISFRLKSVLHETVTVVDESTLLDPTSTAIGANIPDQFAQKIPLGRSLADIIYLSPGVVKSRLAGPNFSISGGSGYDNVYIVDGVVITNPGFGTMGVVTKDLNFASHTVQGNSGLPVEMIQEVQVITGGFEPEFGEAQGGIINLITKSGTNEFHGQAYIYSTPQSAANELTHQEYALDTGATFGGPLIKDKLFFYGAYNLTTFETTYFVQPDWPGYALVKEVREKSRTDSYSTKITADITPDHSLNFSVFGDPSYRPLSNHDGYQLNTSVDPRKAQSIWHSGTSTQALRWNANFGRNMFLEAQFAHHQNEHENTPDPEYKDLPQIWDETEQLNKGGLGFNEDNFGTNLQYSAKFTNLWKNHQFRYGVQFQDISYSTDWSRPGGPYPLSNGQVAQGYDVFVLDGSEYPEWGLDTIYKVEAIVPAVLSTETEYLNWFVQDSWNLTSTLNVDVGVRWERQRIRGTADGAIGTTFSNNWAPRFGAAYDYRNNGKSKLYFHYGRYFEKIPNHLARWFAPLNREEFFFSDANLTQLLSNQPYTHKHLILEVEGHGDSRSAFRTRAQYSDEWVAGIEQEVKSGLSLGARFVHRNTGNVVENILVNPGAPCVPLSEGGCSFAPIKIEEQEDGPWILTNVDGHIPGVPALVRNYKALEITAEKRLSNRWQLLGSYRYAHLNGNYEGGDQNISAAGNFALSPTSEFVWAEGPLSNDIRHMVKVFSSYQLLSNLNTGVAFYFETGRPITPFARHVVGAFYIAPRGSYGRTDSVTSVDFHADYSIPIFGKQQVSLAMDIFNVFNSHAVTGVEQMAGTFIPNNLPYFQSHNQFLDSISFQPSREVRFLIRYSF